MKFNNNWCVHDFTVNRYHWRWRGFAASLPVRRENLEDLVTLFEEVGLPVWLQGKTLLGIVEEGELLPDHDDDVGIWAKDWNEKRAKVVPLLECAGFECIRDTESIVSFLRGERYIDICLFTGRGGRAGYGVKWFTKNHFLNLTAISYRGRRWPIPGNAVKLLNQMYRPGRVQCAFERLRGHAQRIRQIHARAKKTALDKMLAWPHQVRQRAAPWMRCLGIRYQQIDERFFRSLLIEPSDSFNWRWRKPHLDLVTDQGVLCSAGMIADHFRNPSVMAQVVERIVETDTTTPFNDPANFDPRFWQSGNNYFINCILYQYRKGVVPYQSANDYVKSRQKPKLYSAEYYAQLPEMTDYEIETLLKDQPIEVQQGAVTSGKHRVFAMIGRLASGKPFLPLWVVEKKL
jgi:hypothetical protein